MLAFVLSAVLAPAQLPVLKPDGIAMKDPAGKVIQLRGTNLGNWFVIEPWMLGLTEAPWAVGDQHEIETILTERFGEKEKDRLMDRWKASWITQRDFAIIRSFGMNVVRLPMNYRQFEDDRRPKQLRRDAWKWVDRAIDMAEKAGIYTILDMHGVQGGQSVYDHTGRRNQNKLWSEPANQERLAWLWGELAKRYRNRSAVVAYDVFNEPYGGTKPQQVAVFRKVLEEIRRHDPDKLVFAHGNWDDFRHYGNPGTNGWRNVGFQMHYYPGLFGFGNPTTVTHARHLRHLESVAKTVQSLNVPFLVGEMNVVFNRAGGPAMMRRTFDTHARYGWMTTMWSYKVLSGEGGHGDASWGMVANQEPIRRINFRSSTVKEIEDWMQWIATKTYAVNEPLREWLTKPNPELPPLPEIPAPLSSVPYRDVLPGWEAFDIGGSRQGGLQKLEGSRFTLYGAGEDIWGERDQCRFLARKVTGDFSVSVTLVRHPDVDQFAKAGLMLRSSTDADAPTLLLSVFPNGDAQIASRASKGSAMAGEPGFAAGIPVRLRLERRGDQVTLSRQKDGKWIQVGQHRFPDAQAWVGVVALSHDNDNLTGIVYEDLVFSP